MDFCGEHGLKWKFSAVRTPQQNRVVERNNGKTQEMARTMLKDSKLGDTFWAQEVHTKVHILNRGMLKSNIDKSPYKL
jgi:transposase InsO family protein